VSKGRRVRGVAWIAPRAVLPLSLALLAPGCAERREPERRPIAARGDLAGDELATIELFAQASPSVVYITSLAYRRDFFRMNAVEIPQGTGSGIVWDREGRVITNFHVIQGASAAKVTLGDNSTWDAELVGAAPDQDLAVLRIAAPAEALHPLAVGTSTDLLVGQKVFAIGNPFGLDHTLTTGIISALGREITTVTGRTIGGVIQTDAAINPGNSGGPLLDSAGSLIGMNTAILSPSGTSSGVGFAVPVDTIRRLVPQLIEHGQVARAGLGVQIADDHTTRRLGVRGVLVAQVEEGSAAAAAGLQGTRRDARGRLVLGDVIVGVGKKAVGTMHELADALDEFAVGDTVAVTVRRGEREIAVPVVLQEMPQQ
jgi:S1-C subfamily serine protease